MAVAGARFRAVAEGDALAGLQGRENLTGVFAVNQILGRQVIPEVFRYGKISLHTLIAGDDGSIRHTQEGGGIHAEEGGLQ